jgi:hypothetical protein
MVGAAAESILLALAIAKLANEEEVIKRYEARGGRNTLVNLLVGQQGPAIANPFQAGMKLLSYWRDAAAHGRSVLISSAEADLALRELLILSQFSFDNWTALTETS